MIPEMSPICINQISNTLDRSRREWVKVRQHRSMGDGGLSVIALRPDV